MCNCIATESDTHKILFQLRKGGEVGMTYQRMIELLEIEHECMLRKSHDECMLRKSHDVCDGNCCVCELAQDNYELHEMYINVITTLKAQEPRVMTLEEVDALGDDAIVWLECLYTVDGKSTITLKPAIYQSENSGPEEDGYYCVVSSWGQSGFYHKDNYMVDWRCWTSRPDQATREATPWN